MKKSSKLKGRIHAVARKRFEKAKKKAPKESVDLTLLVSGVAHEFNNILGAADGHAEWALESGQIEDLKEALNIVRLACKRSLEITRALSLFNQPKEESYKKVSPRVFESDLKKLFGVQMADKNIQYEVHLDAAEIFGNEREIFEALVNLVKNAMEAFPKTWKAPKICVLGKKKPSVYEFSVSDNAPKINKIYLDKIFNPFFSTKGVISNSLPLRPNENQSSSGPNRGLGLYLARKIALEHGGNLQIKNSGSTKIFILKIPCYTKGV